MINLSTIKDVTTNALGRTSLIASKYGPTVMVGAGVAGLIVSTVLACKATLKVEGVIAEANKNIDLAHQSHDAVVPDQCTEDEYKRALVVIHARKWFNVAKLYALPAGIGALSIASIIGSHSIMSSRNTALLAAYKVVEKGYKNYRQNVIEQLGPEKDNEFRFGVREEPGEIVAVDENGEVVEEKKKRKAVVASDYAIFFDEKSSQYRNDPITNRYTITTIQDFMNDLLRLRGHVFLNEVYDRLGFPRTGAGQVVGWFRDDPNKRIDFGIYAPINKDFVDGYDPVALLDFNIDEGTIHDKL